ncbi:hypothetical protein [Streptomyces sp. NBC_01718]|uniref:hypothetical protein n=1 Tax=Streptomyces sp. NBC_01718 TaxID=2975919 RepID=UPI00352FE226
MTFPTTPLDVRTEIQVASTWVDITSDTLTRDPITIDRGAADEASTSDPSRCSMTLNNRNGTYSPRNPMSPYYGKIGRNTPVRVSVPGPESYLALDGTTSAYARTPDVAALDIVGDIDLRVEATADWTAVQSQSLIGKWDTAANQKCYMLRVEPGLLTFNWSADGAQTQFVSRVMPALPRRAALRATLDVNNGAGGLTVTLYWARSMDGPWTMIGAPFSAAGITSVFAGTPPLEVSPIAASGVVPLTGRVHRAEVRSGIDGTVVAALDTRALTPGTTGWTDAAGRVWTLAGAAEISNREYRFTGEVSTWPPRWDVSGRDVWVPIEAAGVTRRMGQGQKGLSSTLRRRVPSAPGLLAYWPMEEGPAAAASAWSPIRGVKPLQVTGVDWAANDTLGGSSALPTLKNPATLSARVPSTSTNGWQVEFVYNLRALPTVQTEIMRVQVSGAAMETVIVYASTAGIRIEARDEDDAVILGITYNEASALAAFVGSWNRLAIFTGDAGGGRTMLQATWRNVVNATVRYYVSSNPLTAQGRVAGLSAKWGAGTEGMGIGHLAVFNTPGTGGAGSPPASTIFEGADDGFMGETALDRMRRLATEEAAQVELFTVDGDTTSSTERMGSQRPAPLLSLLEEAASTDGGILYENRDRLALTYRDRTSLYNQPVALALDYTARGEVPPPLEPTEDDQHLRNDVTVTRDGGSSGRAVREDGPLSVLPPPAGVGIYDEAVTLSLGDDTQPEPLAAWRMHLGTWDEARYPTITAWLHTAPHLIPDVLAMDIGDRLTIANPPPWLAPGEIDQHVRGYTETLAPFTWTLAMNCTPAGPWSVGVVDDPSLGKVDTDGSELSANATPSDTTLSVATTAGPPWVSDPREYPFDLTVGGEVVTAVAAGPVLSVNPLLLSDLSGWSGLSATIAYDTTVVHRAAGATASIRMTPTGATSASAQQMVSTPVGSITPGDSYTMSGWVYSPTGWSDMRIVTDWDSATNTSISTSPSVAIPVPAGQWTFITTTVTAPALASRGRVRVRIGASPALTDISYWWNVQLRPDAPVTLAADGFDRTTTNGWGAADTGQTWVTNGGSTADYSVSGSIGRHTMNTINVFRHTTVPVASPDVDMRMDFLVSALPVGGQAYVYALLRYIDLTHMYFARVQIAPSGAMTLTLRKRNGAETQLGSAFATGFTYTAATSYTLRLAMGRSTLMVKLWPTAGTEPAGWQITATDTDLTAPGSIGFRTLLDTAVTNAPITAAANNLRAVETGANQRMTVVRSVNGIVKAQTAGTAVSLAHPTTIAL